MGRAVHLDATRSAAELDAIIERCRAARAGKPARSRLILIAIAGLDVDALIQS